MIQTKTRALVAAGALAFMPTWAVAQTELKGSPEELRQFLHPVENIVTLRAEAEEVAYADQAIISLSVKTEAKQMAVAIQRNMDLREEIYTALLDVGVLNQNINNAKFSSSPQYGWFGKQPDSFEVMNRMAVTITEEVHLKTLAAIADKYDNVSLVSTEFKHSQKDDYLARVKEQALTKIMLEKTVYEDSLNVTLIPVNFSDERIFFVPTMGARAFEDELAGMAVSSDVRMKASAEPYVEEQKAAAGFDETQYTANIAVDFKVVVKP